MICYLCSRANDMQEPLILAATIAMSLLQATASESEQIVLLSFLQEVAELSPAILLLL